VTKKTQEPAVNANQIFKHRLIITGLILAAWFTIPLAGVISLSLTLIFIGSLIGTFVRVRPERVPKNIRWFIVIAVGAALSYLLGTLVAAVGAASGAGDIVPGNAASFLVVGTSFMLLLTALFFTARIGIEGYLSWAARSANKNKD
jgi:hypothetical protein